MTSRRQVSKSVQHVFLIHMLQISAHAHLHIDDTSDTTEHKPSLQWMERTDKLDN